MAICHEAIRPASGGSLGQWLARPWPPLGKVRGEAGHHWGGSGERLAQPWPPLEWVRGEAGPALATTAAHTTTLATDSSLTSRRITKMFDFKVAYEDPLKYSSNCLITGR